jgi:RNA polymerase sigma factor for flagellar operon FliA
MLDELRQSDWLPRNVRKNMRMVEAAISKLEQRFGRAPGEQELADEMRVPLAQYQKMLKDGRGYQLLYYEDFRDSEDGDFFERYAADKRSNPLDLIQDERFCAMVVAAIDTLPEREKTVMGLYYEQDLNLKEIGAVLGVSESRVCQLHGQAVARLRSRLRHWTDSP